MSNVGEELTNADLEEMERDEEQLGDGDGKITMDEFVNMMAPDQLLRDLRQGVDEAEPPNRRSEPDWKLLLNKLKLSALQKRAVSAGVNESQLSDALDSDNPKQALLQALVALYDQPRSSTPPLRSSTPRTASLSSRGGLVGWIKKGSPTTRGVGNGTASTPPKRN
eukprot:COSAG05_NODE_3105_length_2320_cov_1.261594_3_plen_166_part_00